MREPVNIIFQKIKKSGSFCRIIVGYDAIYLSIQGHGVGEFGEPIQRWNFITAIKIRVPKFFDRFDAFKLVDLFIESFQRN